LHGATHGTHSTHLTPTFGPNCTRGILRAIT
jgi:hypothetical protein